MSKMFPTLSRASLACAVLGWLGLMIGLMTQPAQFYRSYLLGFALFLGLALGSLSLVMLHHLTKGGWGFVLKRPLEAAMSNVVLMALLSTFILIGIESIYPWARPDVVAHDEVLQHKAFYLNAGFFRLRIIAYFVIWAGMVTLLRKWSFESDEGKGDATRLSDRMKALSGPGLVVYGLTMTFAAVDLLMSLDPHWFSTIYALLLIVIQALSALAFGTAFGALSGGAGRLRTSEAQNHFHDLGNLMLAFVMLWAYMMLSQYLIIWSGNLPEEIPWYIARTKDSWGTVSVALVVFHFILPFLFLLFRSNKRNLKTIGSLASFLIVMVMLDFFWFITPTFYANGVEIHWLDFASIIGIGGLWLWTFLWQLERRPLVPLHDPDLPVVFKAQGASHG
jgi:hypothetical protein